MAECHTYNYTSCTPFEIPDNSGLETAALWITLVAGFLFLVFCIGLCLYFEHFIYQGRIIKSEIREDGEFGGVVYHRQNQKTGRWEPYRPSTIEEAVSYFEDEVATLNAYLEDFYLDVKQVKTEEKLLIKARQELRDQREKELKLTQQSVERLQAQNRADQEREKAEKAAEKERKKQAKQKAKAEKAEQAEQAKQAKQKKG